MSKAPDLSVFPIPRKGSAKPLSTATPSENTVTATARELGAPLKAQTERERAMQDSRPTASDPEVSRNRQLHEPQVSSGGTSIPAQSGQTVALTVKLDEDRYLRLSDAGRPGPGRLKRRSNQDIMVEALDEWLRRRGL